MAVAYEVTNQKFRADCERYFPLSPQLLYGKIVKSSGAVHLQKSDKNFSSSKANGKTYVNFESYYQEKIERIEIMDTSPSECFLMVPQEFLVCVTIHKARNLSVLNANIYVKVILDKKSKSTKVFQNSENPFFNEYFVFELSCTLPELLRLAIIFEVRKQTCCRKDPKIGELLLDLANVWKQAGHSYYKKWGRLENLFEAPSSDLTEYEAFLQIDISIVSRHEPPTLNVFEAEDDDNFRRNLLHLEDEGEQPHNVRYVFSIFKGTFNKKMDYIVQISFAGMTIKTKVQKTTENPQWNEEISFSWHFPGLCRTILIQILAHEHLHWKTICDNEINLDEITVPGHWPTFGPTYLHFYDTLQSNEYLGRLLISIESEKYQKANSIHRISVSKPISAIDESKFWNNEEFAVVCVVWAGDFLHATASNVKFCIKMGESTSNIVECFLKSYDSANLKYFQQESPHRAIFLNCQLPDSRDKFLMDHFMAQFLNKIKTHLNNFKLFKLKNPLDPVLWAKCLKGIINNLVEDIKTESIKFQPSPTKPPTNWDKNRTNHVRGYFEDMVKTFDQYSNMLKSSSSNFADNIELVCREIYGKVSEIESLASRRIQDYWPDLVINLIIGGKVMAICTLNPHEYTFSQRPGSSGRLCGQRHNLIFKDLNCHHTCKKCGCIYGKVDAWIWIGAESERQELCKVDGWTEEEPQYYGVTQETDFMCNLYIHQAKMRPGSDKTGLCDAKVRVSFINLHQETSVVPQSLSPMWNEVITFEKSRLPGSVASYMKNTMLIGIEVRDMDSKKKSELVGSGFVKPLVKPLSWDGAPLRILYERPNDNLQKNLKIKEKSSVSPGRQDFLNKIRTKLALQQFSELENQFPPPLVWLPISNQGVVFGEILLSAELIEVKSELDRPDRSEIKQNLPIEICPIMRKYKVEVVFAGLRNCQISKFISTIGKYKIGFLFGDLSLESGLSGARLGKSINFLDLYAAGIVCLPEQLEYWPTIIITQIDCSKENKTTIGAGILPKADKYFIPGEEGCAPNKMTTVTFLEEGLRESYLIIEDAFFGGFNIQCIDYVTFLWGRVETEKENVPLLKSDFRAHPTKRHLTTIFKDMKLKNPFKNKLRNEEYELLTMKKDDIEFNWWTKFYNSQSCIQIEDSREKHHLVIFSSELENQPEFSYFQDWAEPIKLVRGIIYKRNRPPKEESYGSLKCHVEIRKCNSLHGSVSGNLKLFKNNFNQRFQKLSELITEIPIIVRVYVVQGIRLRSRDILSPSDAFVKLQFGSQKISDRANYVPNQANPIFGKRFELQGVIPKDHILHISVYDRDLCDDLIGCTCVDLEDRLRTKHQATVGIANEYSSAGYNIWRDDRKPYEILKQVCKKHSFPPPNFIGNKIQVGDLVVEDSTHIDKDEDLKERLSLSALKRLAEIPEIGYKLVPEHVETRSLYRPDRPGIEQGKIQLWVEMYTPDRVPPPIDITPIPPMPYELRVTIFNTADVLLQEKNVFGTPMSDIYVKAWLDDVERAQYTDVHYRSITGEGNFNWRMIFSLRYSKVEEMMMVTRKGAVFDLFDTDLKVPPVLYVQIWDNDTFSPDDFLGALDINLSNFLQPSTSKKNCSLTQSYPNEKSKRNRVNLFNQREIRGWFPMKAKNKKGSTVLAGKIEMELTVFNEQEALSNPVGLGRDPPNPLPYPSRPETSFRWFSNPIESIKHIIAPKMAKLLCYSGIALLIVLILIGIFYTWPGNLMDGFTQ